MSQEDLAKLCGISPSAISMYEMGRRKPKDDIVEALADAFNVPKWSILYSENEMVPKEEKEDTDWIALAPGFSNLPIEKQVEFKGMLSGIWDTMYNSVKRDDKRKD